jgi:hypothetical protein
MRKTTTVSTIHYATTLTRHGVVLEDLGDTINIRVPRLKWFAHSKPRVAAFLLALATTVLLTILLSTGRVRSRQIGLPLAGLWFGSGVLTWLTGWNVLLRIGDFRQEFEFRVSKTSLDIIARGFPYSNDPERHQEWHMPIQQIGSIRGDLYGMGLTIQHVGQDMPEFLHHAPKELRVAIATALMDAIKRLQG